jgi:hypothetical protein
MFSGEVEPEGSDVVIALGFRRGFWGCLLVARP